jgi:hypothetical protein
VSLTVSGGATPQGEITEPWLPAAVPGSIATEPHQCVWVRLDAPGVNFVDAGVRRNIDFVNLSRHRAKATISGTGYPAPASGSHHHFVLTTHVRAIAQPRGEKAEGGADRTWLWIVDAVRRIGESFEVGDAVAEVVDPSPGQFGLIAHHSGPDTDVFVNELSGGGIVRRGRHYELRVPHDGEVTITTLIAAEPPGAVKPPDPDPDPDRDPKPHGCLGWLLGLIAFVRRLLR